MRAISMGRKPKTATAMLDAFRPFQGLELARAFSAGPIQGLERSQEAGMESLQL